MADPTPFLAAVAWGLVEGPPFDAHAERVFRGRLNLELAKHKLYMDVETVFQSNGPSSRLRTWYLYARPKKRRYAPKVSGGLQFVTRVAYAHIHGDDHAGAAAGECDHHSGD